MIAPGTLSRQIRQSPLLRGSLLPAAVFVLYLAAIALFSYSRPYYNWDLAGYLGAAFRLEGKDTTAVHERTYATLRTEVPEAAYKELCSPADPYKLRMAEDPVEFARQVHLYSIRPLYTTLLAVADLLGAPVVRVTVIISILSVIGTGIVVRSWLGRHLTAWGATVSAILVLSAARIPDLARYSTPDAFACFLFISGVYLLAQGRRRVPGYFVLWLSILARTDYAVPFLIFVAFTRYRESGAFSAGGAGTALPARQFALLVSACIAAVAAIHVLSGNLIWEGMPYARGFVVTIRQLFLNDLFIVLPGFIGVNIATLIHARTRPGAARFPVQISLIALVSLAARMILFPHLADRFYPVEYILTGIGFVLVMAGNAPGVHGTDGSPAATR